MTPPDLGVLSQLTATAKLPYLQGIIVAPDQRTRAWTFKMLGAFAQSIAAGQFPDALAQMRGLPTEQQVDFIYNCAMLLDAAMRDEIGVAPDRITEFGGISVPPADVLNVRGYSTPARRALVSIWQGNGNAVMEMVKVHGASHAASVIAVAGTGMLFTWQAETGEGLSAIVQALIDCDAGR